MLSFANAQLSFFVLFFLCFAGLVASAPATHNRHHLHSRPFPYGKLADRLLHVNDRNYDVSYMMDSDGHNEDIVRVHPEDHSLPFSPGLPITAPITSFEPKPSLPVNTIPNVDTGTKNILSFAYRMQDIIKELVVQNVQEWDTTLIRWRAMAIDQWNLL